ncbi:MULTISPECIES: HNH endonuclease [Pseudoalteromonas]|uniref:HNH endonuclease n=1 Tax=Pseudoalteromonas TaxID=53246 RepID=UPI0001EF8308|nr:HNH endonuclease signature motif containing protein [Pseudoalteromonas sp. SM9913]ADT70351.1 putative restriction endonuclease [Pseudoalteromonas sp. SM9913]PHQ95055.1 MAG: HNH endonuclease [Pseudoalteromonas sp.]
MLNAKFYETYYFCNVIKNTLQDQFELARALNEFYGDGNVTYLIETFPKFSLFHKYLYFVINRIYYENLNKFAENKSKRLPIEGALKFHSIPHISFQSYMEKNENNTKHYDDLIHNYMEHLNDAYDQLLTHTVEEVFYILFQNRDLLMEFNLMISGALEREDLKEIDSDLVTKRGRLKRGHIPQWVKRAVYFRDRGQCVLCNKDLSGIVSLDNKENYDHIVALAQYGFNDVTNIQLLCKECNQNEKKAGEAVTSNSYQKWYK